MFAFMNEGNAALDAGDKPGPAAIAAWQKAEGILGVTSRVVAMRVESRDVGAPEAPDLSEEPPADANEESQRTWALQWALRRKQAKSARDYAEADRIRGILKQAGWEVRDGKDGSVEVVRIKRAS
jgi:cysteinyl-tRNA synthetase